MATSGAPKSTRLPSFNDFSRGIFKDDLRPILRAVAAHPGDRKAIVAAWTSGPLKKVTNHRRVSGNIPITLGSTGLASNLVLTPFGRSVLAAASAKDAA